MNNDVEKMLEQVAKELINRGWKEAQQEIVFRLLKNGKLSLEEIAECSKMDLEDIKQMQK